jgi:hypothetical protein
MRLYFDKLKAKEFVWLMRRLRPQADMYARHGTKEPGYDHVIIGEKLNLYTGIDKETKLFRIMVYTKAENI